MGWAGDTFQAMANAHKLLEDALELPEDERERLAWSLLDSLHDEGADEDAGRAWAEEIRRRLADLRAGRSKGRPWHEVEASLASRLGSR